MEAWFEKTILEPDFPFRLFISEGTDATPHHWHEEIEIIYMLKGSLTAGINNTKYELKEDDILLISSGDIHYFLPEYNGSKRLVIQFNLSIFDNLLSGRSERKEIRPLFHRSKRLSSFWQESVKNEMVCQIKALIREYNEQEEGYKLALKARLYDLIVLLIRKVPMETLTKDEEGKQKAVLGRLENIFRYVEKNYSSEITLEKIAKEAGFSIYHFTRFFKHNTGMTFNQYLSNYRITQAEWELLNNNGNITEVAFKCGFNSVKTFNRVFKELKNCSPTQYKKSKI